MVGGLPADTRIMHIVPDIRDVMASLLHLSWTTQLELYFPRLWSNVNLNLNAISQGKPEYLLLRYEDFVQDPAATIERACRHLGVDGTPKQPSPASRHQRRTQGGSYSGQRQRVGGLEYVISSLLFDDICRRAVHRG